MRVIDATGNYGDTNHAESFDFVSGHGIGPTSSRGWAIGRNRGDDWIGGVPTLWALDAGGKATAPAKLGRYSTYSTYGPFLTLSPEHPQRVALYRTRSLKITGLARGSRIADETPWKAHQKAMKATKPK